MSTTTAQHTNDSAKAEAVALRLPETSSMQVGAGFGLLAVVAQVAAIARRRWARHDDPSCC